MLGASTRLVFGEKVSRCECYLTDLSFTKLVRIFPHAERMPLHHPPILS